MLSRLLFVLAALVLIPTMLHAQERIDWRNTLVVIIANHDYTNAPDLPFAEDDGHAMFEFAEQGLGVPKHNIRTLFNASRTEFEQMFDPGRWLDRQVQRTKGNVLVYISGHGVPDQAQQAYFVPSQSDPSFPSDLYPRAKVVAALERARSFQEGRERRVLALFDSCFSGDSSQGAVTPGKTGLPSAAVEISDPITIFSATASQGIAYPDADSGLSALTSAFLQGMTGEADSTTQGGDGDNQVSLAELGSYLQRSVPLLSGRGQHPDIQLGTDFSFRPYTLASLRPRLAAKEGQRRWQDLEAQPRFSSALGLSAEELQPRLRQLRQTNAQVRKLQSWCRRQPPQACSAFAEPLAALLDDLLTTRLELDDQLAWIAAEDPDTFSIDCDAYRRSCAQLQARQSGYTCLHEDDMTFECPLPDDGLLATARANKTPAAWQAYLDSCVNCDALYEARTRLAELEAAGRERLEQERLARLRKEDLSAWNAVRGSRNAKDFETYLSGCNEVCAYQHEARLKTADLSSPKAGETFRDCADCPLMTVIPAGGFMMGSNHGDTDENPVHWVEIRKDFAMGIHEVTFAEWDACVSDGYCQSNKRPDDKGWGRNDRPVISVSWLEITASGRLGFVSWLNSKVAGNPYRLPSEAEWEYAARAGTDTKYWWGDGIRCDQANFGNGWDESCASSNPGQTRAVGKSGKANAFGLYDAHGNVSEWVQDCRQIDYKNGPRTEMAHTTADYCTFRGRRGGSWNSRPYFLRSADRGWGNSSFRNDYIGFRITKTL